MSESEVLRTAALIVAAQLRGDHMGVELLFGTLHPDHVRIVAIASVGAMAGLLAEYLPADAIQRAVTEAQSLAREAAQEGTQS
ncbi:hypothetical protein ACIBWG_02045 [Streptomyces griseoaurantiacus]|uniref:hypothetical protein n=1 Tax=Streptomyces griseoaurantiacus TaxID=68213 RepID=UPI0037AC14F0